MLKLLNASQSFVSHSTAKCCCSSPIQPRHTTGRLEHDFLDPCGESKYMEHVERECPESGNADEQKAMMANAVAHNLCVKKKEQFAVSVSSSLDSEDSTRISNISQLQTAKYWQLQSHSDWFLV